MKAVILAGGLGTRISEETVTKPKPMVEIGGFPILWHIMKIYSSHNINEFIICCGYKGYLIKEYFFNYNNHNSDLQISFKDNKIKILNKKEENWNIMLIDTGKKTMTGGRLKRIKNYLEGDENFLMTYGDGVSNVNIKETINFHKKHKKLATMTVAYPPARFGSTKIINNEVVSFDEKPVGEGGMINAGFFVLSKKTLDLIKSDETIWEQEPLKTLSNKGELMGYKHEGFWQPMDTLRDKNYLEKIWNLDNAPWKNW